MTERKKKILLYSFAAGLLALILIGIYAVIAARSVSYSGRFTAEVGAGIEIVRGENGFPGIRAGSWNDAYLAMGYVHAQDRLLLIEYYRALANGRLSELEGREALVMDRISRIMGFSKRADEIAPRLSALHMSYLESYAKGINLFKRKKIKELVRLYSIPYSKWTSKDVIALLLAREWAQGYLNNKELVFPLSVESGKFQLKDVIPEDMLFYYSEAEQKNIFVLKEIRKIISAFAGQGTAGFAAFVPGSWTADGKSKMFYNLDAATSLYPAYYPLRVSIGDKTVEGISAAGLPFIIVGKNNSISFAGFTLKMDSQDFYLEEARTSDGEDQYFSRGMWKNFERRTERIYLGRGRRADSVTVDVRASDRGPVISDAFQGMFKTDVIICRPVLPDESYIAALFELPLADSLAQAQRTAANVFSLPKLYLLTAGDKALLQYSGKVPVRGYPDRIFKREAGWPGVMDLSAYFTLKDNDSLVAGDAIFENAPAAVKNYIQFNDTSRLSRLRELIGTGRNTDNSYIESILLDSYSTTASKYIPAIMPVLQKIPITSGRLCRIYFDGWDFQMTKDSVPASIFQTMLVKMVSETLSDELKNDIDDIIDNHYYFADKFLDAFVADKSLLFDDASTRDRIEFRDMIFDRAFLEAMRFLNGRRGPIMEDWKWGDVHTGRLSIPLVKSSYMTRKMFMEESKGISGGFSTLHKGAFSASGGFKVNEVTALSGVFDEGGGRVAQFYGCSMNPSSEYFEQYREKRKFTTIAASKAEHTLILAPKK